ncbi:MarR family winged helix-turn-helix transcriptional regulator [Mesorhizobium sp.]|uniref:MarR family winged helix-turn-helix transcriptional regulator n=1 Tax=Mesorhizobium sp. TaxID=1871066 RepID=UPI0025BC92C7|nr:MarR family winged helix-turn-helix transcriptional regulator [Mesorhizobium sp.]
MASYPAIFKYRAGFCVMWTRPGVIAAHRLASMPVACFLGAMTEPTQEQVEQLTIAFERFTRRFKVAEAVAAAENALNALDAQTLVFICDNAGCGAADVARYLDVAPTTMSSAIDRLVRKGLVERRRPEENRRTVALTATAKGVQVVGDQKAGYRNACMAMLRSLNASERQELIRLTEKIADTKVE